MARDAGYFGGSMALSPDELEVSLSTTPIVLMDHHGVRSTTLFVRILRI